MHVDPPLALAIIIVLGTTAQWLAWRMRVPSILLLLAAGFLAGPATGWINPDKLFGDLLLPIVSLSVALILFEGGLNLKWRELRGVGAVVRNLVTIGAVVTWVIAAAAARWIVGLDLGLALLLGAILVVTGPTVVLPLLRHIRPSGSVGGILKWEGIVIDPIGASLAVIVFEIVAGGKLDHAAAHVALTLLKTVVIGGGLGLVAAGVLVVALQRYWVPDTLQTSVALLLVAAAFAGANLAQPESGLLAVTVMGIALGNQRRADVRLITEFKEHLQTFLLAALFILLSARVKLSDLEVLGVPAVLFVLTLILVARPLAVFLSTWRSPLTWRQRLFLMSLAPRGIVAAAVVSVFALALEQGGHAQARLLVPLTFGTILGTVLVYGLAAPRVARALNLSDRDPQGLLLAGAGPLARAIAKALAAHEIRTLLVDTNRDNVRVARLAGFTAYHGSILGERVLDDIDLAGIGRLLALTPSDEVNVLAVRRFVRLFGRSNVYQLPPRGGEKGRTELEQHLHGRWLFAADATEERLEALVADGMTVRSTKLTETFDYPAFRQRNSGAMPLFLMDDQRRLSVLATDLKVEPRAGYTIVALVPPAKEAPPAATDSSAMATAAAPSAPHTTGTPATTTAALPPL